MNLHILTPCRAKPATLLPRGRYMLTDDTVIALSKIPGISTPIAFPDEAGNIRNPAPWVTLPNGSHVGAYEDDSDGGRLCCVHTNFDPRTVSAAQYDADQLLLDRYLDA